MLHVVVDGANVVGARPDGWWRDRAEAARKLAGNVVAVLVSEPDELVEALHAGPPEPDATGVTVRVHLVLEGAARAVEDLPTHPLLEVVRAPADGDAAIVGLAAELASTPDGVLVVTADRALRERVQAAGASVVGPGTFLDALPPT